MFNLGVASSVAKKYGYSWQHTADFATRLKLNVLQLYLNSTDSVQHVPAVTRFNHIYLHLPDTAYRSTLAISKLCMKFREYYGSNNLIIHQPHPLTVVDFIKRLNHLVEKGFKIGIENNRNPDFNAYFKLLKYIKGKSDYYAVIDIHKLFYNFYQSIDIGIILNSLRCLLQFCKLGNIDIVLHIIDASSFSGGREFWLPIFKGILPYRDIFEYILNKGIDIEAIIFEYEDERRTRQSVKNMRQLIKRDRN